MIDKTKIEKLVKEHIQGSGIFLVSVRISATGRITILADRKGGITIEECAAISRFLEKNLDRNTEDYELQVSSPGLDMPFLVKEQYFKNEGMQIEVIDNEGKKYTGVLKNVNEGGFELDAEIKVRGSGKKKTSMTVEVSFNYEQVRSAREVVTFK